MGHFVRSIPLIDSLCTIKRFICRNSHRFILEAFLHQFIKFLIHFVNLFGGCLIQID